MTRFIAGFAIGFSHIWQISLVTLSVVPLIAIFGGTYVYIATGLFAGVRKSYVYAGEIAEEVDIFVRNFLCQNGCHVNHAKLL